MRKITTTEIEFILNDIEKRGIVTEDVKYNILDHVCCIIENEISPEMDFKKFYRNTIAQFYRNELSEIEEETNLLLTFKNYHNMKRILKISSITSIILILLGAIFKSMHWNGAGVIIVLGLTFFSLIFVPLNIVLKLKDNTKNNNKLIIIVGFLTVSTSTIGVLFKIMHWPGANMLMISSLLLFVVIFIPTYFIINYRNPDTKFNSIIHTTFMVGAAGMLFALINLGYSTKQIKKENKTEKIECKKHSSSTKLVVLK